MKNEELKKKIAQIISEYCCPSGKTHKQLYGDDRMCYSKMNFEECNPITECADALIAAGIGDVKEAEHRAEVLERAIKIYKKQYGDIRFFNFNIAIKQAKKELEEERKDD